VRRVHHLGIIPDGGRRWAGLRDISLLQSYRLSMTRLCEATEALFDHGVSTISIYLLSKANLARSQFEVDAISLAIADLLEGLKRSGPVIGLAGDLSLVGEELRVTVGEAILARPPTSKRVNLCIAYDPWDEVRSAHALAGSSNLFEHLWVTEPIDLIIRTGDAQTLSNFLPLQAAYARIVFRSELFNDLNVEDLLGEVKHHEGQRLLYGE